MVSVPVTAIVMVGLDCGIIVAVNCGLETKEFDNPELFTEIV